MARNTSRRFTEAEVAAIVAEALKSQKGESLSQKRERGAGGTCDKKSCEDYGRKFATKNGYDSHVEGRKHSKGTNSNPAITPDIAEVISLAVAEALKAIVR
jgi:hypothetical protein